MDSRIKIPTIALLGLSLTECQPESETDSIVGDWRAVEVDMDVYPVGGGPGGGRRGFAMHIDDDLLGEFSMYQTVEYDDLNLDRELIVSLAVDAEAAPKYRVDLERFPISVYDGYGGYGDEYSEPYEPMPLPDEESGGTPRAAEPHFVFDCALAGDELECTAISDTPEAEELHLWRFTRNRAET